MGKPTKQRGPGPGRGAATGSGELLRQAARMQRRVDEVRKELVGREVSTTGADGQVAVTVTCEGRVRKISVEPGFLQTEGLEMALDAVTATLNSALNRAEALAQAELDKATGGLKIPGVTA